MNTIKNLRIDLLLIFLLTSTLMGMAVMNIISFIFSIIVLFLILKNNDFEYFKQNWLWFLGLFYVIIILSTLASEYRNEIFLKNLGLIRFFILALCVQYCLKKYQNENLFLYTIVLITTFLAIDSLVQYLFGVNLFGNNISAEHISRRRLTSVFGDEEIVGSFLIKFVGLGLIGFFLLSKKNTSITYIYYGFISFIILVSQERMAFILLLFQLFLIFCFLLWRKKFKQTFSIIIISSILSVTFFSLDPSLKYRYLSIFNTDSGIADIDFDKENKNLNNLKLSNLKNVNINFEDSMWGAHYLTALQIFKNNFFLGSGPRSFRYECSKKKYENLDIIYIKRRCSSHPHNYYLEILSEIGILGFVSFSTILILFYFRQFKFYLKKKNLKHLCGLLSLFVNLWPIASTGSIYSSFNGTILWITVGYILSFSYKN